MKDPYFVFSTVARDDKGTPVPRGRYCVFRGFFGELKLRPSEEDDLKKDHKDGLNPTAFESDMLTFTTDVRMAKVDQLVQSGGAAEAVFWVKEVASQWRVKGKAFVIGGSPAEKEELDARAEIRRTLRILQQGDVVANNKLWSWDKEVTAYFACLHPIRRGSFKNPPPGLPVAENPTHSDFEFGEEVTDLHDPVARKNFRVVVIRPEEIDQVDLSDYRKGQRWKWTLSNNVDGQWRKIELWP
jgi:hypothetical protein